MVATGLRRVKPPEPLCDRRPLRDRSALTDAVTARTVETNPEIMVGKPVIRGNANLPSNWMLRQPVLA